MVSPSGVSCEFFLMTWDMLQNNLTPKMACYGKCPGTLFVVSIFTGLQGKGFKMH